MRMKLPWGGPGDYIGEMGNANFAELYSGLLSVGDTYYLDPTNGDDANDGTLGAPVKTLDVGYSLLRDGCNDALVYIPGSASISLSAEFVWSKNYAHFIGASTRVPFSPRARIFMAVAGAGATSLFTITGQGCLFSNLLFFYGVNDNTPAYAVTVSGSRNVFDHCHIAGIGNATMDVAGAGSLLISGGAENLFEDCVIGLDTVARGANSAELVFDANATRNTFRRCIFDAYISNAGHPFIKIADATGIDRVQKFEACSFIADSVNRTIALTSVCSIPAGITQGMLDFDALCHVSAWGTAPEWDSNARGIVSAAMIAPTASAAGGISTHV